MRSSSRQSGAAAATCIGWTMRRSSSSHGHPGADRGGAAVGGRRLNDRRKGTALHKKCALENEHAAACLLCMDMRLLVCYVLCAKHFFL